MATSEDFSALVERLEPGARLGGSRRLTGGVSADVHAVAFELPGGRRRTVVVRQHRAAEWKPRHTGVARMEYELLTALHAAGIPVPEPVLLDESGQLFPVPFLVTEFVEGSSEIPAGRLNSSLDVMARTLARVHAVPRTGLPDLPARTDPLPELFDYLPETADNVALREHLSLCTDSSYEGEPALLHGDYWPANLLWQQDRLAAILDWEDAALGDPLSDVASCRLELCWKFGPTAADRFTRAYAREHPLDPRRLAIWGVYVASAGAHFMGEWGLEASREAAMRRNAEAFVQQAAAVLLAR